MLIQEVMARVRRSAAGTWEALALLLQPSLGVGQGPGQVQARDPPSWGGRGLQAPSSPGSRSNFHI